MAGGPITVAVAAAGYTHLGLSRPMNTDVMLAATYRYIYITGS